MKKSYQWMSLTFASACLILSSCHKKSDSIWEDNKTAGNYKDKEGNAIWSSDLGYGQKREDLISPTEGAFLPLNEEDLKPQFADAAIPQPKNTPGEEGSGLPGIDHFQIPTSALSAVFQTLHFQTDDHILRGQESLAIVDKIAAYLKSHPHTYIFIEGHCDERGPEAYNLSLGTRRANYVRSLLVQKGVDLNQIHTISYGKEIPLDPGHSEKAWHKNRRAQFRIYQKS